MLFRHDRGWGIQQAATGADAHAQPPNQFEDLLRQLQASGALQDMGAAVPGGRAVAIIDVEEDTSDYNIPGGAAAQVAVYTP